jgi:hypothetical protein
MDLCKWYFRSRHWLAKMQISLLLLLLLQRPHTSMQFSSAQFALGWTKVAVATVVGFGSGGRWVGNSIFDQEAKSCFFFSRKSVCCVSTTKNIYYVRFRCVCVYVWSIHLSRFEIPAERPDVTNEVKKKKRREIRSTRPSYSRQLLQYLK